MSSVLVLCTGNSCRSIIAEALINANLEGINACSAGVNPSGKVNQNAKTILLKHNIWNKNYYSKNIDVLSNIKFDLVVTVCDHAKENCPLFSQNTQKIHVGFVDPDGKDIEEFEKTYIDIKEILLTKIKDFFNVAK